MNRSLRGIRWPDRRTGNSQGRVRSVWRVAMAIHGPTEKPRWTLTSSRRRKPTSACSRLRAPLRLHNSRLTRCLWPRGAVEIKAGHERIDATSRDLLSLDLLLVTPATEAAWRTRMRVRWERGEVWVVSRQGLISLNRLRGSGQDQDDIRRLERTSREGRHVA